MFLPQAHKRGHSETFLGDGYVYYVDCGDNLMSEWDINIQIKLSSFCTSIILNKA